MTHPAATPPAIPDHQLLHRIGEGSYGEVWLARNATGTLRAVKIVFRSRFSDDRPYEREFDGLKHFEPVSRTHPGFVDILQIGRDDATGCFYYVMELADDAASEAGNPKPEIRNPKEACAPESRREHRQSAIGNWLPYTPLTLESRIRVEGRLPVKDSVAIGLTLAEALGHLHDHGLVHRDIKPSNIIFVGGVPKLADIGLVARADSARTFVGTEGFIPPEGPGSPQADIYSLGKCLYEMAMGKDRQAFPSPPTLLDDSPDRAELVELNQVIARACDPQPTRRYRSGATLAADLAIIQAGNSLMTAWRKRNKKRAALVVGALILAATAVWQGSWLLRGPRLEEVREFSLPGNRPAFSALLGRFESPTNLALIAAAEANIAAVSLEGVVLAQQHPLPRMNSDFIAPCLLADTDGDGRDEIFAFWREVTNAHVSVLNQWLVETRRFDAAGSMMEGPTGPKPSSSLRPLLFLPARGPQPPLLLTTLETSYALEPRDVRLFNLTNQTQVWKSPFPAMANQATAATSADGSPTTFFVGTQSHCNGAKSTDGFDDSHSYLYALSAQDGRRLWITTNGPGYVTTTPVLATLHGSNVLFAASWRGYELSLHATRKYPADKWQPTLLKLDLQGRELARTNLPYPLGPIQVADLDGTGSTQILSPCGDGSLLVLDENLRLRKRTPLVPQDYQWVNLEIAAIQDLDGDGRPEVIISAKQIEFVSGTNPGRTDGEANVRRLHGNSVIVLDHRLQPLARRTIHPTQAQASFKVLVAPPGSAGGPAVLALDQTVTVLRFNRR